MESERRSGIDLFRQELNGCQRIALDTSTLIYFLEGSPRYDAYVRHAFREVEAGNLSVVLSVMVEQELLVKPLRSESWHATGAIVEFISTFPNVEVVPVSRSIAQRAAEIRARGHTSAFNSILVATAIEASCDAILGNDVYCARHIANLPYLCLEEFARHEL